MRLTSAVIEQEYKLQNYTKCYFCKQLRSTLYIALSILFSCRISPGKQQQKYLTDAARITSLIKKGDSIYRQKSSYGDFVRSLEIYDSAEQYANKLMDTALIAEAVYAKGRAYDATNNNPQRTIEYYTRAATLIKEIPGRYNDALYVKHLVAHSYDKISDSASCATILVSLYNEIKPMPDSMKKQLRFTPEMALISTVIKNYPLADSILENLTKISWIKNDSIEYDYLNHYYLTKARTEVFYQKKMHSVYLDSVEDVFNKATNFSDSAYISSELLSLYRYTGQQDKVSWYEKINFGLSEKLNNPATVNNLEYRLNTLEVAGIVEKRKQDQLQLKNKTIIVALISGLLVLLVGFVFFLIRKNMIIVANRRKLQLTVKELNEKNMENSLLNKEMSHRVKNNLQMILSLVFMQERQSKTDETKKTLKDIRFRIESVAHLHEQLLVQNDQNLDLTQFIKKLLTTMPGLMYPGVQVKQQLDIEPVKISGTNSFALGQLLNELITNSIKYATKDDNTLEIFCRVKKAGTQILVHYSDSGKPVNKKNVTDNLGMSIINLLLIKLEAICQRSEENYFSYDINFAHDGE